MPYVKEFVRNRLDATSRLPEMETSGELNYVLTQVYIAYLKQHGISYQSFNDIAGAIHNSYAELYRRKIAPHESTQKAKNGDVY